MAYYLGIDGGGTKTRCALGNETSLLATAMSGGSNIVRLGEPQARESIHAVIRQVCAAASVSPDKIRAVCIGAAGAGRSEVAAKIHAMVAELIPDISPTTLEVVGDTVVALEAAFGEGPGVMVIAGTGSIAYGRDGNGGTARAGGWGFAVSDEGSGYWIGRSAISEILSARDQDLETALTGAVLHAWKLNGIDDLVLCANATPPPDFPRLFPAVLHAASEGDALARTVLSAAGTRLAGLAANVVRRLTSDGAGNVLPVAMTGSVFRQSAEVREVFYHTLRTSFPEIEVRQDLADPVEGALARARRK